MANFAYVENNNIVELHDNLPTNWKNISNFFTLVDETEYLQSLGWYVVVKDTREIDETQYYRGDPTYQFVDNQVVENIPQIPHPPQQPYGAVKIGLHNTAMALLREKRDILLKESDFSQLSDVIAVNGPELTQAYVTYRQALRDMPNSYESNEDFIDASILEYPKLQLTPPVVATTETPPGGV